LLQVKIQMTNDSRWIWWVKTYEILVSRSCGDVAPCQLVNR